MRRRPTRRAFVTAAIGGMLVLAGATAQAGWLFVLAAGVLSLVGSSFVFPHPRSVAIEHRVPRRVRVGDDARIGITVTNNGRRWLPMAVIEDRLGAFDHSVVAHEPIPPGARAYLELVRRARTRGVYESAEVSWTSGSPFGLARSSRKVIVPSVTTVIPRWIDLATFPILEPSSFPADVVHERARTGAGEEYLGVRDYRPGDPLKTVHWRSTARAGRLVVREFEQESSVRVGLALAGVDHGDPPDSAFEMLISAIASIGIYALSTGHPIDAARANGDKADHIGSPDRGRLLEWLAAAVPHDGSLEQPVSALLSRIGRRGTIVLFAPDTGVAGASVAAAARLVQSAGARSIAVLARSQTWGAGETSITEPVERVPVRWMSRGEELAACLLG